MAPSCNNQIYLYNKKHKLEILYKDTGQTEERSLNITILNVNDSLQIKMRDPTEYCFNFTEDIDLGDFEVMRVNQNLDINYREFKANLVEMLEQSQGNEMYLRCEVMNEVCTMIFYGKSKIKCIVYLTVDLHSTNQKEILTELVGNLQSIQEFNDKLKKQLSSLKKCVTEKDQQITHMELITKQLEKQFFKNLKHVEEFFGMKLKETETLLTNKIVMTQRRLLSLLKNIDGIKTELLLKTQSNSQLVKLVEKLKLNLAESETALNHVKMENNNLREEKMSFDDNMVQLRNALTDVESHNLELQKKNDELHSDLEQATIIIQQKKTTIDELSQDLLQANQMLVNFNKHYDDKMKQTEELEHIIKLKSNIIDDHLTKEKNLVFEFDRYRNLYNSDIQGRLENELSLARNKIEELEVAIRKANKINTLLTDKVNQFQKSLQS